MKKCHLKQEWDLILCFSVSFPIQILGLIMLILTNSPIFILLIIAGFSVGIVILVGYEILEMLKHGNAR